MSRRKGKGAAAAAEHGFSERTKDALAAKKAQGVKLGGLNAGGVAKRDAALERARALPPIFDELDGKSAREIARILNDRKVATPTGAPWSAVTVKVHPRRHRHRCAAVVHCLVPMLCWRCSRRRANAPAASASANWARSNRQPVNEIVLVLVGIAHSGPRRR